MGRAALSRVGSNVETVRSVDSGMSFDEQNVYERVQKEIRRRARIRRTGSRRRNAEHRRLEQRVEVLLTLLQE